MGASQVSNPATSSAGADHSFAEAIPGYVDLKTLAKTIGCSERTLKRWHAARRGPPRCQIGNLILFRVEAVREWLAANETRPVVRSGGRSR